MDGGEHVIW